MNCIDNILVSVVIPSYSRPKSLESAIESVLNQTHKNVEVIVVDDNNPDSVWRRETSILMEKYSGNSKVIYVLNDKNSERSYSRNHGVAESHGQYVMFLDNDDEYLPEKIESQLSAIIAAGDEYQMSYSNYVRVRAGKIICKCGEQRSGNLIVDAMSRNLFIHPGSNLLVRKEVFLQAGGFDESISINEDIELLVRLFTFTKIVFCPILGLVVHFDQPSTSNCNFEEITKDFQRRISRILNTVSKENQAIIRKNHGLQIALECRKKRINKLVWVKREYELSYLDFIKYGFYYVKRKLEKKAYSFQL